MLIIVKFAIRCTGKMYNKPLEKSKYVQHIVSECVKQFHGQRDIEIKRGKEMVRTTVEQECSRQLDIYLANAKTRIKIRAKRQDS